MGAEQDVEYSTTLHADGLETSSLSLRFKAQEKHFTGSGNMNLKCTSNLSRLYKIQNEAQLIVYNSVEKQQQLSSNHISENLSQGLSIFFSKEYSV